MNTTAKSLWTLACLAALGLAAAVAQGPTPASPPAASPPSGGSRAGGLAMVPDPIWDAGIVGRGQVVRHDFEIRNTGGEVLYLREVRTACGCTVVSFDEQIAPGGSGRVTAEVATEAFRGAISKDVTVLTSDPVNPMLTLTVRAQVQPWVDALPGYFRFVHVQGEPDLVATQTLWSADQPDFTVTGVQSPQKHLAVSFRPAAEQERDAEGKGRQWVVVGTLSGDAPSGPLQGDVVVRTNHPQQPELLLPIAGYVRPQIAISPPIADFGSFEPTEPRRGSVIVTNHGAAPLTVLSAESDVPGLSAQLASRENGKRWDVTLTLAAGVAAGPIDGTLRLRTDSPRHPLLEVPVRGQVRGQGR
jgi:hypothetical protein